MNLRVLLVVAVVALTGAVALGATPSDGSRARVLATGDALSEGVDQLDWVAPSVLAFIGNYTLYVVTPGGKPKPLASNIEDPAFSRDSSGERFAVDVSACSQGRCPSRILIVDRTKGRRMTIGGPRSFFAQPSLSPDGLHVAFTSERGLMVARVNGTGMRKIASGSCASWSPDGSSILFLGRGGSLQLVSPAGGRSVVLVAHGVPCGYAPSRFGWSPDGRRIALIGPHGDRLSVLDVASRTLRTFAGFAQVTGFAWSPDGSELLVAAPDGCSSIWRVRADGSGRRLVLPSC